MKPGAAVISERAAARLDEAVRLTAEETDGDYFEGLALIRQAVERAYTKAALQILREHGASIRQAACLVGISKSAANKILNEKELWKSEH